MSNHVLYSSNQNIIVNNITLVTKYRQIHLRLCLSIINLVVVISVLDQVTLAVLQED